MRYAAGLLLVVAAVLKAMELFHQPTIVLVDSRGSWLIPHHIGVELGLGLLVLIGICWRQVRWLALVVFVAFAIYSFRLAVGGAISCGCFGPFKLHPWWTFSLDVAVVLGLLISILRTRELAASRRRHAPDWLHQRAAGALILGVSALSMAVLARYAGSRTASAEGQLPATGGLVILEPEKWIGKRLPIADAIDLDLSRGEWIVLLHRHDCPDCQAAVPQYENLAAGSPGPQIALVEVPPYGDSVAWSGACRHARLRGDRNWFVQTPVEIQLVEGIVTSASTDLPTLTSLTAH